MKFKASRVTDRVAYFAIAVTSFEVAGIVMSFGKAAVYIYAPIATLVWATLFALMLFVPDYVANRLKDRKRRIDRCPACDYELPSEGLQRCPECGIESTILQREDNNETRKVLARNFAVSGKLVLAAYFAALGLTLAEYATTYVFGRAAYRKAEALRYTRTTRLCDGWVIWSYQEAEVFGGEVYDDTQIAGISPEVFWADPWAPWPHRAALFYCEDDRGGRVFTYED